MLVSGWVYTVLFSPRDLSCRNFSNGSKFENGHLPKVPKVTFPGATGSAIYHVHPRKLTWRAPKIAIFERRYISKTIILGIYVSFGGMYIVHKESPQKNNHQSQQQPPKLLLPKFGAFNWRQCCCFFPFRCFQK